MRLFRRWQQRLTATVLDRDETAESVEAAKMKRGRLMTKVGSSFFEHQRPLRNRGRLMYAISQILINEATRGHMLDNLQKRMMPLIG